MVNVGKNYRRVYNRLMGWGFLPFEMREFARQYSMKQIRSLPYIVNMSRWRRLYVSNARSRGLSDRQIIARLYDLYGRQGWLTPEGNPDSWQMLKRFRRRAIDEGDYFPVKRKGGHHPPGVSKGDVEGQRRRRREREKDMSAAQRGDVTAWIAQLEERKVEAQRLGDFDEVAEIDRRIDNLRRTI